MGKTLKNNSVTDNSCKSINLSELDMNDPPQEGFSAPSKTSNLTNFVSKKIEATQAHYTLETDH